MSELNPQNIRVKPRWTKGFASWSFVAYGMNRKAIKGLKIDERQLVWTEAIINSMTPWERQNPQQINGSRRKRIASGSGRSVQQVNQLLKQFAQMKKMMKNMGKMKMPGMPNMSADSLNLM